MATELEVKQRERKEILDEIKRKRAISAQSEDRAHRISQTKKVTYIDLISDGTVDEFIVKNLRGKINLATKVLGEEFKKWLI